MAEGDVAEAEASVPQQIGFPIALSAGLEAGDDLPELGMEIALAQLLATGFGFVSMNAMTAGWILSGASSQWKNAKPGKVFDTRGPRCRPRDDDGWKAGAHRRLRR